MVYRRDWGQPQVGPMGFMGTRKVIGRVVTINAIAVTGDNITGNTVGAFKVPAGFTVTGIIAVNTQLDSGAGLVLSIGDAASAGRYISASTAFRSAATNVTLAATGLLFLNILDTEILITIGTQSATPVAGTIALYLDGWMAQ